MNEWVNKPNTWGERSRLSKDEAEEEAAKIQDVAGENASPEEYEIARQIVDEQAHSSLRNKDWSETLKEFRKERLMIEPPDPIHNNWKISFYTEDPAVFDLFNRVAARVTRDYMGFNQSNEGHGKPIGKASGYTLWELWNLPKDVHPSSIVDKIWEEMNKEKELWYKELHS
jgi:hypothetical protein